MTHVIGHRGASGSAPENTLSAFWLADAMGADGVELDVRLTADGRLAVHHDPELTDGRVIAELAFADLPEQVPSLEAVLAVCTEFAVVNIELKDLPGEPGHDPGIPLASAVVDAVVGSGLVDRVLVSSFDVAAVDRVREIASGIATGLLAKVTLGGPATVPLIERCAERGHDAFHPHHGGVDATVVARCHEAGLAINTWTVDDPARIVELERMGVDGIVTNRPDVALVALGRRAG